MSPLINDQHVSSFYLDCIVLFVCMCLKNQFIDEIHSNNYDTAMLTYSAYNDDEA